MFSRTRSLDLLAPKPAVRSTSNFDVPKIRLLSSRRSLDGLRRSSSTISVSTTSSDLCNADSKPEVDQIKPTILRSFEDLTKEARLVQYLDEMEKKVDEQREKVHELRLQHSCSEKNSLPRIPSPSDEEIRRRIKHLQVVSKWCVEETRDFVVVYNRNCEDRCHVEAAEYQHLIDFCSDLCNDISTKLYGEEDITVWKKTKRFLKHVTKPLRRMFRRA